MNQEFTKKLGAWLSKPAEERDLEEGALLLLKLTRNRVQYASIMQNPAKYAAFLDYQLQKHYDFRVASLTISELKELKKESEAIAVRIGISESEATATEESASFSGYGKRPDHDLLPENIRQLYVDNLEIRRKMQQLHLQIRTKYNEITNCTASDVYAFVKELLRFEKLYLGNWEKYDNATPAE